jgi:hypothetical protein
VACHQSDWIHTFLAPVMDAHPLGAQCQATAKATGQQRRRRAIGQPTVAGSAALVLTIGVPS